MPAVLAFRSAATEAVGEMDRETPGADRVVQVLLDDQPGPVYLQMWAEPTRSPKLCPLFGKSIRPTPPEAGVAVVVVCRGGDRKSVV